MLRLDKGFAGKGTSVAVRIIVADKCRTGQRPPSTINRASVGKLLEAIRQVPPRAAPPPEPEPPTRPQTSKPGSLFGAFRAARSEEHTSELQSLMRSSYAVFGLQKKT